MTTNNTIYIDSPMSDDLRRHAVYQGQIFVYLRSAAVKPASSNSPAG
jgi:hypothetical protein